MTKSRETGVSLVTPGLKDGAPQHARDMDLGKLGRHGVTIL